MTKLLNQTAYELCETALSRADELRVACSRLGNGCRVVDCGVEAEGGLEAGLMLARVCVADRAVVDLIPAAIRDEMWPFIQVRTDAPVEACLLSQYAGWEVSVDGYFGMGSGPMRAAAAQEEIFRELDYRETETQVVGVLESGKLPNKAVAESIAKQARVDPASLTLFVAPTASQAGNVQVVARSVETALHKLHELHFDVTRVRSAWGTAPLPPVAADDLTGIGRTNDAILYGATVVLWVAGDDASLADVGPQVPSTASSAHGKPFLEIFEDAGRNFYEIDRLLFSPARIIMHNLHSGVIHRFGKTTPELLERSFGMTATKPSCS